MNYDWLWNHWIGDFHRVAVKVLPATVGDDNCAAAERAVTTSLPCSCSAMHVGLPTLYKTQTVSACDHAVSHL